LKIKSNGDRKISETLNMMQHQHRKPQDTSLNCLG